MGAAHILYNTIQSNADMLPVNVEIIIWSEKFCLILLNKIFQFFSCSSSWIFRKVLRVCKFWI